MRAQEYKFCVVIYTMRTSYFESSINWSRVALKVAAKTPLIPARLGNKTKWRCGLWPTFFRFLPYTFFLLQDNRSHMEAPAEYHSDVPYLLIFWLFWKQYSGQLLGPYSILSILFLPYHLALLLFTCSIHVHYTTRSPAEHQMSLNFSSVPPAIVGVQASHSSLTMRRQCV